MRSIWLVALCFVAGCETMSDVTETVKGAVGIEESNAAKPAELLDFEPSVDVNKAWSGRYGKGVEELYIALIPEHAGSRVYTADRDGRVISLDLESGDEIWAVRNKKFRISGGPGVGAGAVLIGTSDAEVVAYSAENGEEMWRTKVSSEVLAPPRIDRATAVIRTGDGKLFGLDVNSGKRKWIYDRSIPTLTLRGTSPPVIHEGLVIAGFDNGRLAALDLENGKQEWEQRIAIPSGRSDLERMVDIDSEPIIYDDTIYIASFQGSIAAVSVFDGSLLWTRDLSSYATLAVDYAHVYVTDEKGNVWALERDSGTAVWKQEGLTARQLTGPTAYEDFVVVGDLEGYLHWIDRSTGSLVARTRIDGDRILVPAKDADSLLLGFSSSGRLSAFRIGEKIVQSEPAEPLEEESVEEQTTDQEEIYDIDDQL
ncbi:MAG: outer membrane protein assembly factor BamB [Pseudomonadota bacterium]